MKKRTVKKLIEKIEGEATLDFEFREGVVSHVDISFASTRGIEEILKGKYITDALIINPRVCGICGHAHLQATVKAIEDCFELIKIPKNAKIIRELTLNFELIQNHFKWFYLTLLPLLGERQKLILASKISSVVAKAIAVLGGQYPHNSYAIPGGVVGKPTNVDLLEIKNILKESISWFEQNLVKADTKELINCDKTERILERDGDLPQLLRRLTEMGWHERGKSFDRFIVFGESLYFKRGKSIATKLQPNISESYIKTSPNINSFAKNATYKNRYYEVGPLSRAMMLKTPLIKDAHRRYGDSLFSRIIARVCESLQLLYHSLEIIDDIDLNEPTYIEPITPTFELSGKGVGAVEAARGSLVHKVEVEKGIIKSYEIITPTQWNLSNGTKASLATAQKAMIGSTSRSEAEFVFKSFDVCSVCTTH
jgi:hydrogenase large subunit